jgi:hypothetical protein
MSNEVLDAEDSHSCRREWGRAWKGHCGLKETERDDEAHAICWANDSDILMQL